MPDAEMNSFGLTMKQIWTVLCLLPLARFVQMCPEGNFFDEELGACAQCTPCRVNEIVRIPCGVNGDSICGPFREFQSFNQPHKLNLSTSGRHNYSTGVTTGAVEKDGAWQTVTMVLIVALCVTGIFFVTLVTITFRICRRRRKEALLPSDRESEVEINNAPSTSRSRIEQFEIVEET